MRKPWNTAESIRTDKDQGRNRRTSSALVDLDCLRDHLLIALPGKKPLQPQLHFRVPPYQITKSRIRIIRDIRDQRRNDCGVGLSDLRLHELGVTRPALM